MDNLVDRLLVTALLAWIVYRLFVAPRRRPALPLILAAVGLLQVLTAHVPWPDFAVAALRAI